MKKTLLPIVVIVCIVLFARPFFCSGGDKKAKEQQEEVKQGPLSINENTDAFNQSYTRLLTAYFNLKDALVASDTAKATAAAHALVIASDSLKVNEIKGDSTGLIKETAKNFTGTISGSAQSVAQEKDLNGKRKSFEAIGNDLWSLTRTVQYNGQKVYWEYCPMAFDKKGAYWLSNEREIKNPYFGTQMLNCGSVEDSLDYSSK